RCKRNRQNWHACVHASAHQSVQDGLGDKLVTINPSVDNERSSDDGGISPRGRKVTGKQRQLEGPWNIKHVYLFGRHKLAKAIERPVHDFSMPISFDEGIAGGCHRDLLCGDTSPKAITRAPGCPKGHQKSPVLSHPDFYRRL